MSDRASLLLLYCELSFVGTFLSFVGALVIYSVLGGGPNGRPPPQTQLQAPAQRSGSSVQCVQRCRSLCGLTLPALTASICNSNDFELGSPV